MPKLKLPRMRNLRELSTRRNWNWFLPETCSSSCIESFGRRAATIEAQINEYKHNIPSLASIVIPIYNLSLMQNPIKQCQVTIAVNSFAIPYVIFGYSCIDFRKPRDGVTVQMLHN